eukprot:CAMPEP_0197660886 /NCGR_PEP_ID=MMETSP1338-20131121/51122_1 /TAXON_ID=43686 ORGANISM="Pelagodinium beii, Strain RCC1491" /NCGR_SAMPLE_ID=MMETSP1338 /ASSEMBLY_ACC=CAM_ASM_000754 /LENGTH=432 /DNA_ID=CAMNT_0043238333 /DNA_START=63 /DNA_END=1361 /DNA_ORIENTATION=+
MSRLLVSRMIRTTPVWTCAKELNLRCISAGHASVASSWSSSSIAAAAAVGLVAAGALKTSGSSPVASEEMPEYVPPPRFSGKFAELPDRPPLDEAGQLAWAVKHMEVEQVRSALQKWPRGAALVDKEDNTLFHLAASQPQRCAAQPASAGEVFAMLLRSGWSVVDQKNRNGERAEIVAARLDATGPAKHLLTARSHNFSESIRAQETLQLIGEMSPRAWQWEYPVQDEQRRSFAGVNYRAFSEEQCQKWMDTLLREGAWANIPGVPRKTIWYVSEDCADCPYRYSGLEYPATVFPPFMQEIREELCKLCGIPEGDYPNSCNINVYEDHTQEVGWHSDDEVYFQGIAGDTRIISFSLGAARDFCWRLQGTTQTLGSVALGDGDVMTMEGLFQKHYKHSVPPSNQPAKKRINMTFRWIKVKAHALDAGVKSAGY